jgi:predicted helicase
MQGMSKPFICEKCDDYEVIKEDMKAKHNNPRYILNLLLSVIKVSLKTMDIVDELPKLEF